MGILSDTQIKDFGIIRNSWEGESPPNTLSHGFTSYGYDARLGRDLRVMLPARNDNFIDVKDPGSFKTSPVELSSDPGGEEWFDIPGHGFVLGVTMEYFDMPADVVAVCLGKSTYARAGLIVNVTPIEPGFQGTITIEISNTMHWPVRVYIGEGIMQVQFHRCEEFCSRTYAEKGGKYQGQEEVTPPRMK